MKKASERRASHVAKNIKQKSLPYDLGDSPAVKAVTGKGYGNDYVPCYKSHKPLELTSGFKIYGGSCHTPVVTDADIYVGLDHSMAYAYLAHPWEEGEAIHYPITDHHAPKDAASFIKMVDWLAEQIVAGKKVHAGCVGGHGRTGILLSALVKVMRGEADAIAYVREHYCKKAVESEAQVKFLVKQFGILTAEASKPTYYPAVTASKKYDALGDDKTVEYKLTAVKPWKEAASIWGRATPWAQT
jgi:hypothetical protein